MFDSDAVEIAVTGPADGTLAGIADELLEARLVACANVLDATVTSVYRWKGRVERERERRMWLHTRAELVDAVTAFVVARHPAEVPSVIALPLRGGSAAYVAWVCAETAGPAT